VHADDIIDNGEVEGNNVDDFTTAEDSDQEEMIPKGAEASDVVPVEHPPPPPFRKPRPQAMEINPAALGFIDNEMEYTPDRKQTTLIKDSPKEPVVTGLRRKSRKKIEDLWRDIDKMERMIRQPLAYIMIRRPPKQVQEEPLKFNHDGEYSDELLDIMPGPMAISAKALVNLQLMTIRTPLAQENMISQKVHLQPIPDAPSPLQEELNRESDSVSSDRKNVLKSLSRSDSSDLDSRKSSPNLLPVLIADVNGVPLRMVSSQRKKNKKRTKHT